MIQLGCKQGGTAGFGLLYATTAGGREACPHPPLMKLLGWLQRQLDVFTTRLVTETAPVLPP